MVDDHTMLHVLVTREIITFGTQKKMKQNWYDFALLLLPDPESTLLLCRFHHFHFKAFSSPTTLLLLLLSNPTTILFSSFRSAQYLALGFSSFFSLQIFVFSRRPGCFVVPTLFRARRHSQFACVGNISFSFASRIRLSFFFLFLFFLCENLICIIIIAFVRGYLCMISNDIRRIYFCSVGILFGF